MTTGSLINLMLSKSADPTPVVGMPATILGYTDRTPATVIEVTGQRVTVQADTWARIDANGQSEQQTYSYARDPGGARYTFQLDRRTNHWRRVEQNKGRWVLAGDRVGLRLGVRERYYDFSF